MDTTEPSAQGLNSIAEQSTTASAISNSPHRQMWDQQSCAKPQRDLCPARINAYCLSNCRLITLCTVQIELMAGDDQLPSSIAVGTELPTGPFN